MVNAHHGKHVCVKLHASAGMMMPATNVPPDSHSLPAGASWRLLCGLGPTESFLQAPSPAVWVMEAAETSQGLVGPPGVSWGLLGPGTVSSSLLASPGRIASFLGLSVTRESERDLLKAP